MRRSTIPTALAAALALAALPQGASASAAMTAHDSGPSPGGSLAYWTPERMRAAEPLEAAPSVPPAGSGAPQAGTAAQPPDVEVDPGRDTAYPERLHGKLFFTRVGVDQSCSATVVRSLARNLLITAGHCLVLSGGKPAWSENVVFAPAYRDGAAPFGLFAAARLRVLRRFAFDPIAALDVGAVSLAPGPAGLIQDSLGARGISFNRPFGKYKKSKTRFQVFGYPGEPAAAYDAERPILCNARFKGFERFSASPVVGPCAMKQGSSGGGFVLKGGTLNSIVSHGPCAVVETCGVIAGTYFGDEAYTVYAKAGGVPKKTRVRLRRCKRAKKLRARLTCRGKVQRFKPVVR